MQPCTPSPHIETLLAALEPDAVLWLVNLEQQTMTFWRDKQCLDGTPVSTSAFGTGNEPGSFRTPVGWHRAAEIIGRSAAAGQPFVSREPVGDPISGWRGCGEDLILSRIVVLEGLEPGVNHLSRPRYIYIHGTGEEDRLGSPCSHGCIRVGNLALIRWIDRLGDTLPYVWVG